MKTIKWVTLMLSISSFAHGQTFEGKIIYKNEYKSKMANVADDQFSSMMGTTQEYYIKGGNYKSSTNGTFMQWQLYINGDNKLYSKMSSSPNISWTDCTVNADEMVNLQINKKVTTVLGHLCDELILTCKSGVQKYYFNSKYRIDSKLYTKHKFGNWNEIVSRTNAVPLKMIIDSPQVSWECVAVQIIPMTLDSKIFELPAGSIVENGQN